MRTVVECAVPCYQCDRLVSFAAYCVLATLLVMTLSDVYVIFSVQLTLVVLDLTYDLT